MKGYKVFNPDWTCRDFKYEVGQTYTHDGNIDVCKAGFHFCQKPAECFYYYRFDASNHVAEIEAIGNVKTADGKSVTDKIKIIREIPWNEVLELVNIGKNCTGFENTGNKNTGNRNTGDYNTGDRNTGNGNTGDWNAINYSSGFFNTISQPIMAFNKPLEISRIAFISTEGIQLLNQKLNMTVWVPTADMSDAERERHPEHKTHGGYLKTLDFKTACRQMWDNFTDDERRAVREIPNFDPAVFEEITGIDARKL